MSAFINLITSYSPLHRNQQQSSGISVKGSWWGKGGGSAGDDAASVVDGVVGAAAGGERSDDNTEPIENDSFKSLPIVTAVETAERSKKRRRIDGVVPSPTTQYGTLTTVS